jgi:hypothetical protein
MLNTIPIAGNTYRQTVSAGVFWLVVFLGTFGLWVLLYLPFFTFKEDVKMFKDVGCAWVQTLSLIVGLVSASRVLDEEFENKTAVTLMSKPVRDHELLLGKYLGVALTALTCVLLLWVSFEATAYIRLGIDDFWRARSASFERKLELRNDQWLHFLSLQPCLPIIMLHTLLMTAISTVLSTRFPLAPNLVLSLGVFVLGHLTPVYLSWTEFSYDARVKTVLKADEVPDDVLARLETLQNERWPDEPSLREALGKKLGPAELKSHGNRIIDRCAGWAARRDPARLDEGARWAQFLSIASLRVGMAVVPDLERVYNVMDAVAYKPLVLGADEPVKDKVRFADIWLYAAASALYTLLYVSALMFVGLAMLRRRELTI